MLTGWSLTGLVVSVCSSTFTREFYKVGSRCGNRFRYSTSLLEFSRSSTFAMPESGILGYKEDKYGGVIIDEHTLPGCHESERFRDILRQSLDTWKENGKRGVWLKIPISLASLVGIAVEEGFEYHHAEPSYLMLTTWLGEGSNSLPPNASHQVGVGALVPNEKGEILVVREKRGPLGGTGTWKIPTGLATTGEDISLAAEREVLEETGINAKFRKVLAFRQSHGFLFEKSDLFFVVRLEMISGDLQPQESEIEDVKWMKLEEVEEQPFMKHSQMYQHLANVFRADIEGKYDGMVEEKILSHFNRVPQSLYLHKL